MLEIDSPVSAFSYAFLDLADEHQGHSTSVGKSHPSFVSCNAKEPWSEYAAEPPAGQVNFLNSETTSLFEGIFEEVSSRTSSHYISGGGDEINQACYESDPAFVEALKASGKTYDEALQHFVQKMHDAIRAQGKQPLVWEELVLQHDIGLRETETLVSCLSPVVFPS